MLIVAGGRTVSSTEHGVKKKKKKKKNPIFLFGNKINYLEIRFLILIS